MPPLELDALLHAAGASLGEAQGALMTGVDTPPTVMAIAEATLDMKVTIDGAERGTLQVAPVSAAGVRLGAVEPGALSSISMRFVAFGNDVPGQVQVGATTVDAGGGTVGPPGRDTTTPPSTRFTRDAAIKALQARADIARRIAAGEKIRFGVTQTGDKDDAAWIVTAHTAAGTTVAAAPFAAKI